MWRALVLAVGITLCILGAQCLVVERALLAGSTATEPLDPYSPYNMLPVAEERAIEPPEWAPWSLLSAGAVITLYACTIRSGG
jgi:hypothetical protein